MITNSEQMKHTPQQGVSNSHIYTQCVLLSGVYSRMQTMIKVPNVILQYNVPSILHPLSQLGNSYGTFLRNSKLPHHHVPYVWGSCSIARAVVHHEEQVASQQPYMDVRWPAENAHHLPGEEMAVALGNNLCNVADTLYFNQVWPRVVTDGPPTLWSLRWGLCVVWECTPEDYAHQVSPSTCTSITRIQTEPTLITEDNRAPFHSPVDTFTTPEYSVLGGVVMDQD